MVQWVCQILSQMVHSSENAYKSETTLLLFLVQFHLLAEIIYCQVNSSYRAGLIYPSLGWMIGKEIVVPNEKIGYNGATSI